MNKKVDQFLAQAQKLSLSETEKNAVRQSILTEMKSFEQLSDREKAEGLSALIEYIRAHPLRKWRRFSFGDFFASRTFSAVTAAIVVVALSVTGASAADSSLPGDTLYPVKVSVIEPLREKLAFSAEMRAARVRERIERRLHEMEALRSDDRLTEEWREKIEQHLEEHSENFEERLAVFPEEDERLEQIRTHMEKVLDHHAKKFEELEDDDWTPDDSRRVILKVRMRIRPAISVERIGDDKGNTENRGNGNAHGRPIIVDIVVSSSSANSSDAPNQIMEEEPRPPTRAPSRIPLEGDVRPPLPPLGEPPLQRESHREEDEEEKEEGRSVPEEVTEELEESTRGLRL